MRKCGNRGTWQNISRQLRKTVSIRKIVQNYLHGIILKTKKAREKANYLELRINFAQKESQAKYIKGSGKDPWL